MGVIFPPSKKQPDPPRYKTLDEFQKTPFSKVETCARICEYILQRDDYLPFDVRDGRVSFPDLPPLAPGTTPQQETKILIYQEFPALLPFLRNV